MRFAYADPPYIGQAKKHYGPDAEEVDHHDLIKTLVRDYDAWALSCHVNSVRDLFPLTPGGTRLLAWVKPWCFWKSNNWPVYAWEPVLLWTPRKADKKRTSPRDWISLNVWGVTKKERETPGNVKGMKRPEFTRWLIECAGLLPTDEFFDLYPGSGGVFREWEKWKAEVTT